MLRLSRLRAMVRLQQQELDAEPSEVLLTLFFWFCLVILSALGNSGSLDLRGLSIFIAVGALPPTIAAGVVLLQRHASGFFSLLVFCVFGALVMQPAFAVAPRGEDRTLLLDLYYVLLVTLPALLSLWSWKFQGLAGALALVAVCIMWIPVGSWVAAHSIVLIGLAGMLSTLVVLLRARVLVRDSIHRKARALLGRGAVHRLPHVVWNVVLLQAGLLLAMMFLDIALWGDELSQPLVSKTYGLMVLVFASLLIKAAPAAHLGRWLGVMTVLVGLILSISRVGYHDLHGVLPAVPLVVLALIIAVVPLPLVNQTSVVWGLLLSDILVKLVSSVNRWGWSIELIGYTLFAYRGELALLILGGTAAVMTARRLERHRISSLSYFAGIQAQRDEELLSVGEQVDSLPLKTSSGEVLAPERRQRAIVGLLLVGILSCITSSRILLSLAYPFALAVVLPWGAFSLLWASLIYLDRKPHREEYFWLIAAFVELVLFAGPCALILLAPLAEFYWYFWPACVFLGLAAIPWRTRELLAVLIISTVVGAELAYQLGVRPWEIAVCFCAALLGLLWSVRSTRLLKERLFLAALHFQLDKCETERETLNVLADCIASLFETGSALTSPADGELELVRGGRSFPLNPDQWPLRELQRQLGRPFIAVEGITLHVANFLPSQMSFFDPRFGVFSALHGLLVEIRVPQRRSQSPVRAVSAVSKTPDQTYLVFIVLGMPLIPALRGNELQVVQSMSAIARLQLRQFAEERYQSELVQWSDNRSQEREYELGALVHDINNTVQDLTLLCESISESLEAGAEGSPAAGSMRLRSDLDRIAVIARSMATVVSDAKRKRELERMSDLTPRELVEVKSTLIEIAAFAKLRAERKRIRVELGELPAEDLWIRISVREHLETILRNLLNNAITYSDPGTTVRLELSASSELVWIRVIDNGPGLREDELEAIFASGFRGRSASGVPGGLGLGLAESRRVAESAGGHLVAFSDGEGKGSTFSLSLPRQPAPVAGGSAPWALLVDDQPALTDFYAKLAKALDYTPAIASSVHEAMTILTERGAPSLVITDIHLGSGSGLDLVRHLRRSFGLSLPILVVSGLPDDDVSEQARSAGATDFVAKPVGRRALFARIQSLLPGT